MNSLHRCGNPSCRQMIATFINYCEDCRPDPGKSEESIMAEDKHGWIKRAQIKKTFVEKVEKEYINKTYTQEQQDFIVIGAMEMFDLVWPLEKSADQMEKKWEGKNGIKV